MCQVSYRGVCYDLEVRSWTELFMLCAFAWIKGCAVVKGDLNPLFAENDLGEDVLPKNKTIDAALIAQTKMARNMAEGMAAEIPEENRNGQQLAQMLDKQKAVLQSADKYWLIEQGFFMEMADESGEKMNSRYSRSVLACLPTPEKPTTMRESLDALRALQASPMGKYCGHAVTSHIDTIMGWLNCGLQRVMIKMSVPEAGLLRDARAAMGDFLRRNPSSGGSAAAALVGRPAAQAILKELREKVAAGEKVQLAEMQDLVVFNFLLSVDERKEVHAWAEERLRTKPEAQAGITKKGTKRPRPGSMEKSVSGYYFKK